MHSDAASPTYVTRNLGNGAVKDVTRLAGADFQRPSLLRGAAFADFNNDGALDVAVTAANGPLKLFRNGSKQPGCWIAPRLVGTQSIGLASAPESA